MTTPQNPTQTPEEIAQKIVYETDVCGGEAKALLKAISDAIRTDRASRPAPTEPKRSPEEIAEEICWDKENNRSCTWAYQAIVDAIRAERREP